ncbi:MAG: ABC transporter permease [bacterium]
MKEQPKRMADHSSRRQRLNVEPYLLLVPAGMFVFGLLLIVSLYMLRISLDRYSDAAGHIPGTFTLTNYSRMLSKGLYRGSLILTLRIALEATLITVLFAYPIALFMTRTRSATAIKIVTFALLLPMLMNLFLQSYGWLVIFSPSGLLNSVLTALGRQRVQLMFSENGVLMALIQTGLPLAVFPIASALRNVPRSLEEAAASLGANRLQTMFHVVFQLSLPGVVASSYLLFAYNASAFVVPLLIGGRRVVMLAMLVKELMGPLLAWPLGAAVAVVLIGMALLVLVGYRSLSSRYLERAMGR